LWTEEHNGAFESLKRAKAGCLMLAYPSVQGHFILDSDASDTVISGLNYLKNRMERSVSSRSAA
jgi:hypothetical protein